MGTDAVNERISSALDDLRHLKLKLRNCDEDEPTNPHRPDFSFWPSYSEGKIQVNVSIGPLFGQQQRYIEMTVDEARAFAGKLIDVTDAAEGVVAATKEVSSNAEQE